MVIDIREKENEENYSDPEGFVDDLSDSEIIAELNVQKPSESQYEECCIMVFNIPVVGEDRLVKLRNVLGKLFAMPSKDYKDFYPMNEENSTKGYCFVEYPNKEAAEAACILVDGYVLDKNHTFSSYPLTALRDIKEPDANWRPPQKRQYADVGDLWWWLQNPKCLDQFGIQVENAANGIVTLAVYWFGRGIDPQIVNLETSIRENWSEQIFKWSPHGSFLATFHKMGIKLWGGENFEKVQRFLHENVNFIEFSPNESYLVTYARDLRSSDGENCLRVFDIFTGELKKNFSPSGQGTARIHDWPYFKWSHDEKYFGFCRPRGNNINVMETETFKLADNKPIELDGLISFEWNPTKNLIAYYCEERVNANTPAEIGILEFPSRQKVRAQRIFSVSGASLFWQKSGNYLAAHTERFNNAKKTKDKEVKLTGVVSHLEIFDCTEKEVSVQTIQLPEPFVSFGWEPKGNKFCVLVGGGNKVTPLVYRLEAGKPVPTLISKLEHGIQLNAVEWAPQGSWLSVYAANSSGGQVLFIDATGTEAIRSRMVEHPQMNQGSWDPTGRYFATCSLGRNRAQESSYRIHTFQGRELVRKNIETLLRFKWRPRPPAPLSDSKVKEIRKNMKQISAKFEEEDRREQLKVSKELIEFRRKIMAEFNTIRNHLKELYEKEKPERIALRGGVDTDVLDGDLVEETITIPLTTKMEPLKDDADAKDE